MSEPLILDLGPCECCDDGGEPLCRCCQGLNVSQKAIRTTMDVFGELMPWLTRSDKHGEALALFRALSEVAGDDDE